MFIDQDDRKRHAVLISAKAEVCYVYLFISQNFTDLSDNAWYVVVFKDDHLTFWFKVSLKAIYGYDALLIFTKDRATNAYDAVFSRKTNCDLVFKDAISTCASFGSYAFLVA